MLFSFLQNFLVLSLIIVTCFGFLGLIFYKIDFKKIVSLSVAYTSLVLLFLVITKNNPKAKDLYMLLVTILTIFSVSLICGIGIISNIAKLQSRKYLRNSATD